MTTWRDHDFRPAPAGWTVWECWAEGEAPSTYEAMPLAGWLTQVEHGVDEWGGLAAPTGERRIEPAVWRPEEGGLLSLTEYECINSVVYLVGAGTGTTRPRGRRRRAEAQAAPAEGTTTTSGCQHIACRCEWTCWTCQTPGRCTCPDPFDARPVEPMPSPLVPGGALDGIDLDTTLGRACPGCIYRIGHHPECRERTN